MQGHLLELPRGQGTGVEKNHIPKLTKHSAAINEHPTGLWMNPDVLRRMKDSGGNRGAENFLTERYLRYADISLDESEKKRKASQPKQQKPKRKRPDKV